MRSSILLCFFFSVGMTALAGDSRYPADAIPAALKKNANVVKRFEEVSFDMASTRSAKLHCKYALTVLNEAGDRYAGFSEYYDKFRHIESIEGALYDKSGTLLKKVKTKDFQDLSAVDDISLIDDNRVKQHSFYYRDYPYTVEYEVSISLDQTFSLPSWMPQDFRNLAVEQSTFIVTVPQDYQIRYKAFSYKGDPVQGVEKSRKKYTWQVGGLTPIKSEYAAPEWHEMAPYVRLAPTDFEMDGYKGNMSSWKEFGKFIYALNKDRDQLPEAVKQKVAELTSKATTEREKVEALYKFMQQNTRYISIQLGIGGFQPFEASFVSKKGYGDCKALSNYMYSLLKAAGIKSNYILIRAGDFERFMMEDFPATQFNHAILCVPLQNDTMWLECTSQSVPPGYMGEFTGNRKALLIDENGGTIVSTPRYGLKENTQLRTVKATVDADGTLSMKVNTAYKGVQQDDLFAMLNALSKDKVKKHLQEELELSTYEINDFKYEQQKAVLPAVDEELNITVSNYATVTGKRLFITPNILSRGGTRLIADEERTADFVFEYAYHDGDDEEIEIPGGYEVESAPQDVTINTKYGSYSCSVKVAGNKIIYHRVREQFSGRFPAREQADVVKFLADIYKADRARVVLVKKG